jgi:hypothetical protein
MRASSSAALWIQGCQFTGCPCAACSLIGGKLHPYLQQTVAVPDLTVGFCFTLSQNLLRCARVHSLWVTMHCVYGKLSIVLDMAPNGSLLYC